jgi:hypothetical protein
MLRSLLIGRNEKGDLPMHWYKFLKKALEQYYAHSQNHIYVNNVVNHIQDLFKKMCKILQSEDDIINWAKLFTKYLEAHLNLRVLMVKNLGKTEIPLFEITAAAEKWGNVMEDVLVT